MTKILIELGSQDFPTSGPRFKQFKQSLWQNPLDENSLRLSLYGFGYAKNECKLPSWEFKLSVAVSNKNIIQLERYYPGVYCLHKREKFIVFDEEQATMITLYGDDISQYLVNLESVA